MVERVCGGRFLEYLRFCIMGFEMYSCGEQPLEDFIKSSFIRFEPEERTLKDWILNAFLEMVVTYCRI